MRKLIFVFTLLTVLCCGLFLVDSSNFIVQGAQNVSGVLSVDTVWTKASSPYALTGNVLVSNSITLTIEHGATVNLNGYLLMVNGTLNARGTDTDKIQLNGGTLTFTEYSTDWNEQAVSGSIIEYANLETTMVPSTGSAKVNECVLHGATVTQSTIFSNNLVNGVVTIIDHPSVTGNTINGSLQVFSDLQASPISYNTITGGVYVNAVDAKFDHNTITGGIDVANGPFSITIDSNTISGGLTVGSDTATVSYNTIYGGIKTSSNAISILYNSLYNSNIAIEFVTPTSAHLTGSIVGNTITASQTGVSVPPSSGIFLYGWRTDALIINNTIYNCATAGILVGYGSGSSGSSPPLNNVTVLNNLFYGNGYAIKTEHANLIEGNSFLNNYWAIWAPSLGSQAKNNVVANNTYGITGGMVEHNFVTDNLYGVSGSYIYNNTIIGNNVGVYSGFQTLNYNNIYGNDLNVNYTSTTDGNATYNWWGTTDSAAIGQSIHDYNDDFLLGRVNYTPFLSTLYSQAPSPDTPIPTIPETLSIAAVLALTALAVAAVIAVKAKSKRLSPLCGEQ
jgi:hypothetical protein